MAPTRQERWLRPQHKRGLLGGAFTALALSTALSLAFKPGLFSTPGLVLWHLVAFAVGGAAGYLGTRLTSLKRTSAPLSYLAGALCGALAYALQIAILVSYVFAHTTWE
jgi:hypothetical protein